MVAAAVLRERVWALEQARRMIRAARAARVYRLGGYWECMALAGRFRRIAMEAC